MQTLISKMNITNVIAADERVSINEFIGELKAVNTDTDISFSDLKGKVIFVNFWATWCPPCIAEMQSIQDLYDVYGKEVVFLIITNDDLRKTNSFLDKNDYNLPVYNVKKALSVELEHRTIPSTFIVNKAGDIVIDKRSAVNWNGDQIHEVINQLLKE